MKLSDFAGYETSIADFKFSEVFSDWDVFVLLRVAGDTGELREGYKHFDKIYSKRLENNENLFNQLTDEELELFKEA